MEDQFNNFPPPNGNQFNNPPPPSPEPKKGKSILVPSLIFAVVLFAIGLILFKWQGKEEVEVPKRQVGVEVTQQKQPVQQVEATETDNTEYNKMVEMNQTLLKQLNEMRTQLTALEKETGTSTNTSPTTQEGANQQVTPVESNVEVIEKAKQQGIVPDLQLVNREKLGVTGNIHKEKFKLESKQLATLKDNGIGVTNYTTMYLLRLVNERGLVLTMFTNYTTYSSLVEGTELTVEYLVFNVDGKPVYDISKVEK